jgi:hypothetical protein
MRKGDSVSDMEMVSALGLCLEAGFVAGNAHPAPAKEKAKAKDVVGAACAYGRLKRVFSKPFPARLWLAEGAFELKAAAPETSA